MAPLTQGDVAITSVNFGRLIEGDVLPLELVPGERWKLRSPRLPGGPGLYVFWWLRSPEDFLKSVQNRNMYFCGRDKRTVHWELTEEYLTRCKNGCLPLYLGQVSSSLSRRIRTQLRLTASRDTLLGRAVNYLAIRDEVSFRVRDMLDHYFWMVPDTRELLTNMGVTFLESEGEHSDPRASSILYRLGLEYLRPIFNLQPSTRLWRGALELR